MVSLEELERRLALVQATMNGEEISTSEDTRAGRERNVVRLRLYEALDREKDWLRGATLFYPQERSYPCPTVSLDDVEQTMRQFKEKRLEAKRAYQEKRAASKPKRRKTR